MILNNADNLMYGDTDVLKIYLEDTLIWKRGGIREKTGVPPLTFFADGNPLLDWSITGTARGVGDLGKNKLNFKKYEDDTISNGDGGYINAIDADEGTRSVAIPSGPNNYDWQRWLTIDTEGTDTYKKDYRTDTYNNAQWFAALEPGEYKLILEIINPYMYQIRTSFWNLQNSEPPQYSLIDQNNNIIIKDIDLFDELAPDVYAPTFFRKVKTFTVNSFINVGLISKLYCNYNLYGYRFYIVPANTEDVLFSVTGYDTTFTGYTCWEPYKYKIPVTIRSGNNVTPIDLYTDAPLGANDVLTMAEAGVTIPTYEGSNTIDVHTVFKPSQMYIKYTI